MDLYKKLFAISNNLNINIQFTIQNKPDGIASALVISEEFLNGSPSVLILGDNIFYASGLTGLMNEALVKTSGATILAKEMPNPNEYGVIALDQNGAPTSIEEKPKNPKSNLVVTGLYFYDNTASERARKLERSERGEFEITDLNRSYLEENRLSILNIKRGSLWFDAGSHGNLIEASNLIASIQHRSGVLISSPEEIAYRKGWITIDELNLLVSAMGASSYQNMLLKLVQRELNK